MRRSLSRALLLSALCSCCLAAASWPLPVTDDEFESAITKSIDPAFYQYAQNEGTDKTWDHRYDYLYSRWLAPVRRENLRMLEIGLGCNMGYGAGHSLQLWKKYMSNTKVSYLEYDAACATKHKTDIEAASGGKLYIGDQADATLLEEILADSRDFQGYDVIIDDGGHTANQMLTSIKTLWHALKPGGIYIVEDTSENYIEKEFLAPDTFMAFMKQAMDVVQCRMKPAYMEPDSVVRKEFKEFCAKTNMDILSVECIPEACALIKGKPRERALPGDASHKAAKARHMRHTL